MSRGTLKWKKSFRQTLSVRNKIISDDESTAALVAMVNAARDAIVRDRQHSTFRNILGDLVLQNREVRTVLQSQRDSLVFRDFLCRFSDQTTLDFRKFTTIHETIVDAYIIELLRFLAMKVLLHGVPDAKNNRIVLLKENLQNVLIPSLPIREAWKALAILPILYANVCTVMGCSEPIDYDADLDDLEMEYRFLGVSNEIVQRNRRHYRWTFETYERFFVIEPPVMFWPRLEGDDEEDRDQYMLEDLNEYVNGLSVALKERMSGSANIVLPKDVAISTQSPSQNPS
jgi:hypothetical protein